MPEGTVEMSTETGTTELDLDLVLAFAVEAASASRNILTAERARMEGREDLARLLDAVALAETVSERRARMLLRGKMGETAELLAQLIERKAALAGPEGYAAQADKARAEGRGGAAAALGQFASACARQHALLEKLAAKTAPAERYAVCTVCGYIEPGEAPQACPVCKAVPEKFETPD